MIGYCGLALNGIPMARDYKVILFSKQNYASESITMSQYLNHSLTFHVVCVDVQQSIFPPLRTILVETLIVTLACKSVHDLCN